MKRSEGVEDRGTEERSSNPPRPPACLIFKFTLEMGPFGSQLYGSTTVHRVRGTAVVRRQHYHEYYFNINIELVR